jgi:methionyl-tRNA formyltransferase
LVAVSGTNLVGRKIIAEAASRRGIVNLHTGISPYVKGGPNCTNWCLATRKFDLIGNTVMWLDPGIDTGNIIATERTPLTGDEDLAELHWKVMEHAHDLYRRAIAKIASGEPVASVPQSELGTGPVYYLADWTATQMIKARRNFRTDYREGVRRDSADARLVPLGE